MPAPMMTTSAFCSVEGEGTLRHFRLRDGRLSKVRSSRIIAI